jgi:hypothetical protein
MTVGVDVAVGVSVEVGVCVKVAVWVAVGVSVGRLVAVGVAVGIPAQYVGALERFWGSLPEMLKLKSAALLFVS